MYAIVSPIYSFYLKIRKKKEGERKRFKKKKLIFTLFFFFFCVAVPVTIKSNEKRESRRYNIRVWFSLRLDLVFKIMGFEGCLWYLSPLFQIWT